VIAIAILMGTLPESTKVMLTQKDEQVEKGILYVDDDTDDHTLFAEAIKKIYPNLKCFLLSSADEALQFLDKERPLCIYLDVNLPGMDGFQLLEAIKSDPKNDDIPVFLLSTAASPENIKLAKILGAKEYLTKPNSYRELEDTLKRCFVQYFAGEKLS
jgi:CheY-like chemotaxis protein